ncbi:hypothetical protein Hdeb2414_s0011g00366271 [Helianthus debilis subsp. tardiflorus]
MERKGGPTTPPTSSFAGVDLKEGPNKVMNGGCSSRQRAVVARGFRLLSPATNTNDGPAAVADILAGFGFQQSRLGVSGRIPVTILPFLSLEKW